MAPTWPPVSSSSGVTHLTRHRTNSSGLIRAKTALER